MATKDLYDIETIALKAIQIKAILNNLDPQVSTEVMSLVLAGRPNDEIRSIMDATRARYTRLTGKDIYAKIPKIKINISRA
jgi:hypothetical protein